MRLYTRQTILLVTIGLVSGACGALVFDLLRQDCVHVTTAPVAPLPAPQTKTVVAPTSSGPASPVVVAGLPPQDPAKPYLQLIDVKAPGTYHFRVINRHSLGKGAWVGLIPSAVPHGNEDTNDAHDVTYVWVTPETANYSITSPAGQETQLYDLRLHACWPGCSETHHISVAGPGKCLASGVCGIGRQTIKLSTTYPVIDGQAPPSDPIAVPGETITVRLTSSVALPQDAWVGIVPAHVDHGREEVNDAHDLTYQYVPGLTSGLVHLQVPKTTGRFDVRLNYSDAGGPELASAPVIVATMER